MNEILVSMLVIRLTATGGGAYRYIFVVYKSVKCIMVQLIKARYEKGVLKPLNKLNIQKNKEVELIIFTDTNKFFEIERKLEKMEINYLKLVSGLLPEVELESRENKELREILEENKKEGYVSLDELKNV